MKKTRLLEIIREEIDTAINEIPDFGGRYDSQVADKHGEEDTLQSATDEIVDETLKDMGVTKADLKKDADKAAILYKEIVDASRDLGVDLPKELQNDAIQAVSEITTNDLKMMQSLFDKFKVR